MLDLNSLLFTLCFILAPLFILRMFQKRSAQSRTLPYPPGPKGHPLIGNLLQIPSSHLWEKAVEWGKQYGDLIYLESLGQRILIINSYEDATELLTGRSAKYSSRPLLTMTNDLQEWGWVTAFMPYGETFRQHRTFLQRFIGSPETLNYLETQLSETRAMLKGIIDDPEDYGACVERLPGTVILRNVYGHQVAKNDRYVRIGQLGMKYATEGEHYLFLDILPWLKHIPKWFPFASFHRIAEEGRSISRAMRDELYKLAKQQFSQGTLKDSMTSVFLSESMREDGSILDEDIYTGVAATLYLGAVDTTGTGIMSFVLHMLKNPDVQRKAQSEIDSVIGKDRLPTFEDKEDLPYVRAVCAEVLRYAVISTLLIAHSTTEDDVYHGYHIPAGTTVMANAWAMSFNPKYYPDPLAFKPERWLARPDGEETSRPPYGITFGFGRRACPGQAWAENLLFIAVASLLATFNFEKAVDKHGDPIPPNEQYSPGFVRQLGPSKCKITPRSRNVVSLVESYVHGK